MAIQQVNGNVSTKQTTKNNGGSAVNVGTSIVLNKVSLGYYNAGVFGTAVIDGKDTDKALTAGTFSYSNQRPVAKRVTTALSGVNNTFLRSGASRPELVRSIHRLETLRTRRLTTAIRANKYNRYTGTWDAGYPAIAVDQFYDIANETMSETSTDNAANPSREVPGQLVYTTGAPVPVQDNYKAKTN